MARAVAVAGTGQTKYKSRYPELTQPDLLRTAIRRALEDARLTLDDIDAVVYAMAPDALTGVMHAERWLADASGAIDGKPVIRINTGGATGLSAVQAGYDHIASGAFDTVLICAAERTGESGDAQSILNRIWDPMFERALPLNTITMLAMQAVCFFQKYGTTEEDMAHVSVKRHKAALKNPYAHIQQDVTVEEVLRSRMIAYPIKLLDSCPSSSGAAAMVLTNGETIKRLNERPAWITGLGCAAETYWMGDRTGPKAEAYHADSPALAQSIQTSYAMAGLAAKDMQVAELYAPFSNIELHVIPEAGFASPYEVARRMREGAFDLDGEMPINPSGGVLCSNPIAATALIRGIEAANQVMGRAGDHQVKGVRNALATGIGGDHQFFASMIFSDRPRAGDDLS
ncbi:MAG TPA: thiolase family protein [Alphaproteobacteria bacterium]|nr:thiolase family protein [Alphaproteobacteria bacterium]